MLAPAYRGVLDLGMNGVETNHGRCLLVILKPVTQAGRDLFFPTDRVIFGCESGPAYRHYAAVGGERQAVRGQKENALFRSQVFGATDFVEGPAPGLPVFSDHQAELFPVPF